MLIAGHDKAIAKWVAERCPYGGEFGPCSAVGVSNGEKFLAGVVYHDYHKNHGTIQISMAAVSPMWARPENIRDLLRYPFEQLNCYRVYTTTPADNEPALKVNAHIGFKREAVLAHHYGKKHAVIMRMLKPDYVRKYKNELVCT